MGADNLFTNIPQRVPDEQVHELLSAPNVRIERIVSTGHSTSVNEWLDQDRSEWVLLLAGSAGLLFEGEAEVVRLEPGNHLNIPARKRHRVEWTDPAVPTIWLAVHYG